MMSHEPLSKKNSVIEWVVNAVRLTMEMSQLYRAGMSGEQGVKGRGRVEYIDERVRLVRKCRI